MVEEVREDSPASFIRSLRIDALVLEKTPESPLDCKEIQPVHPKGDQFWMFIGRTDVKAETLTLTT